MSSMMSGKKAILEMLKAEGVEYIFGNPGTSEGPFIDMLGEYPEFKYIMALQESVAIGMGESYARATNKPSFVSLHVDSGLANGIALMLDALNTGTPMVITSANYDARKINESKTDLAELVRPVTKWSVELNLPDQIPSVLRRAFNEANSHPKGPVYVGFTANALEGTANMNILPSTKAFDSVYPDPEAIKKAANLIIQSENPLLMVGDRVSDDDALNEAVQLAELAGFTVYQSRGAEVSFPSTHPQYLGVHSLRNKTHREDLKEYDLVLTVGMETFEELFYWGDVILDQNTKLIHIDPVYDKVGRSEPTDVGIVSNCKTGLNALINSLTNKLDAKYIINRISSIKTKSENQKLTYQKSLEETWATLPMTPARMMYELSQAIPNNSIIVDDSISSRVHLKQNFKSVKRNDIRSVRGQSIGGGIGATIGTKCAFPDRPVIGIIGDGSAMMTIQGLWSAVNDKIPCIFVICNNGMYRVLKVNYKIYQTELLGESEPVAEMLPHSDFNAPINMCYIAKGMGLECENITTPDQIKPALHKALKSEKPYLINISIDGSL
jgi:benzoylformate decarboxylase